jgi:hypothetical protein
VLNGLDGQLNALATGVRGPICSGGANGVPPINASVLSEQATAVSDKLKIVSQALNQTLSIDIAVPK